ncbi:MAG: hypothetical protein IKK48_05295 [Firmicutes bacterium]|nr:hypothetical protein [Bacillota bacterium]
MEKILEKLLEKKKNFVFVGEAGCGKSEIALNFAMGMRKLTDKPVHFFDMDQTKPLFRSRDARARLEEAGVVFHYEEQLFDAPTTVGGVRVCLADPDAIVIMDVGGDHVGARLIGAFEKNLNNPNTQNFFVINAYRPWSRDLISIDGTMARVLGMARIQLENVSVMSNPNLGTTTTAEEAVEGTKKLEEMIGEFLKVDYMCAMKRLCPDIEGTVNMPLLPVELFLTYEWDVPNL